MFNRLNKKASCVIIVGIYAIAIFIGILVYMALDNMINSVLVKMLIADIAATIIVWIFSLITKNSSVYDPYWSVIPVIIAIGFIYVRSTPLTTIDYLAFTAILVWALRLTYNWVKGWNGFSHQDWRYTDLKESSKKLWHITNFFGIQFMPTMFVFFGLVPTYFTLNQVISTKSIIFTSLGAAICIFAAVLEFFADEQMRKFRKQHSGRVIDCGLWKYSRHPNYFGEVTFWCGLFIMSIPNFYWLSLVGPIGMIILFNFISIPLMEKHIIKCKPEYLQYKKEVSMFIPWFKKKKDNDSN